MTDPSLSASSDLAAHRKALLLSRRCMHCAERAPMPVLVGERACPSCGRTSTWSAERREEDFSALVAARFSRRRWVIYGLLVLATLLTGWIPVVPTLVAILFVVYLRYTLLRAPLPWMSPRRQFTTRFALKLWFAVVFGLVAIVNAAMNLLPVGTTIGKIVANVVGVVLFVETALPFLKSRLRAELVHGPRLQTAEWALPATLLGATALVGIAMVVTVVLIAQALGMAVDAIGSW